MRRGNGRSAGVGLTIPGEAVASHGGGVTGVAVVDGQVQGHHAVATGDVGELVRRGNGRSAGVGHAVPSEAVASHGVGVASVAVVDGQVQRDGAVATGNVGELVRRGNGRSAGVGHTVPGEAVASHGSGVTSVAVVDGEVQRDGAVATGNVGEHVSQGLGRGGDVGVLVPVEAVTSHGGGVTGVAVVDGQVQGHNAVATGNVGELVRRGNGRSGVVGHAVPLEAVASHGGGVASVAVTYGQVQRHRAVAVVDGLVHVGGIRRGSHGVGAVVPGERVTHVDGGVASVAVQSEVGVEFHIGGGLVQRVGARGT